MTAGNPLPPATFNKAGGLIQPHPTMALVVDVQLGCFDSMDPAVVKTYLDSIGDALQSLRARDIPVTWVAMSEKGHLYRGDTASPAAATTVRDMAQLEDMEFYGAEQTNENEALYLDFLTQHGPRHSEDVFCKYFFSAFMDMRGHPRGEKLWNDMLNMRPPAFQRPYADIDKILQGPSFHDYLKDKGTKNLIAFGAISDNCVFKTMLDAARKGYNASVCTDLLVSFDDFTREQKPEWYEDEQRVALNAATRSAAITGRMKFATLEQHLAALPEKNDMAPMGPRLARQFP